MFSYFVYLMSKYQTISFFFILFLSHEGSACLKLKPFLELFYFLFLISLLGVKILKDVFNRKSVVFFFYFLFLYSDC